MIPAVQITITSNRGMVTERAQAQDAVRQLFGSSVDPESLEALSLDGDWLANVSDSLWDATVEDGFTERSNGVYTAIIESSAR